MTAKLLIGCIRAYQFTLSPFLGGSCRFLPTCSAYAMEAIATYGAWRGTAFALRRIARCHPLGKSGFDPVPAPHTSDIGLRDSRLEPRASKN